MGALAAWALLVGASQADLERFPPRGEVVAARQFNRAYRAHLLARQGFDLAHWWEHQAAIEDVDARYTIWDALDDAQLAARSGRTGGVRFHMDRLRTLLGPDAFYAGRMPDPVDFSRFEEIP